MTHETDTPKRKIPHPSEGKTDAEKIAAMILSAEQAKAGHYSARNIKVIQGDPLEDGSVPLSIYLERFETNPSEPAAE